MTDPVSVQTAERLTAERKFTEAADVYRSLLEVEENKTDAGLWCGLGRVLILDQQFYDAIDAFTTAATFEPENPKVLAELGDALAAVHEYEEAKLWFEKAASLEDNIRYQLRAGDMLAYLGKYDEALVYYTLLSSKYPENADLLHNKGKVLHHLGRTSDAMNTIGDGRTFTGCPILCKTCGSLQAYRAVAGGRGGVLQGCPSCAGES